MYHKSIPYRRHQKERIIRKRVRKLQSGNIDDVSNWIIPGKFHKWNMSCNCWMCRTKTREQGHKISEQRKLERENDIDE